MTEDPAPGLRHLLGRLALVEHRVRRAVALRQVEDPSPDDPFRGLYLTPEAISRVLDQVRAPLGPDAVEESLLRAVEERADVAERAGAEIRLRRLAAAFGLPPLDVELLLIAVAPDLDPRFEQLYAYLNDDVTRRRASVGMALSLCGLAESGPSARSRLTAEAPLVRGGLLAVEEPDRPFLSRSLRVPDRVAAWLLGVEDPDPALTGVLLDAPAVSCGPEEPLVRALADGVALVHLREEAGGGGTSLAVVAARAAGRAALALDLRRLAEQPDAAGCAGVAVREARLRGAVLVGASAEALAEQPQVLRSLTAGRVPVVLTGRTPTRPRWSSAPDR